MKEQLYILLLPLLPYRVNNFPVFHHIFLGYATHESHHVPKVYMGH